MLKKIYKLLPFKRELFSIVRAVYKPKPSVYKHLYFNGVFEVKVDKQHQFRIKHFGNVIENELFWEGIHGGWEKVSLRLWVDLCKNANCILDIGANTGLYALIAKTMNPEAKVFAFEPVQRVFDKLKFNVELNNFNIECSTNAISNTTGQAIIFDIPNTDHIYSVTVNKNMFTPETPVVEKKINTIKLDEVVDQEKIDKIDLIKIDVETHEPEVLEGYARYIGKHLPTMLIEVLNDDVGKKIESLVKDMDYLYFNIDENKGITRVTEIRKSDYYNYLLCNKETALNLGLLTD